MIFNRVFAPPSHETFKIKPIGELIHRYVGLGIHWADPYAGNNSPAWYTNDIDPDTKAIEHILAEDFVKKLGWDLNGGIIDPPYSYRQISEHYKFLKRKVTALDTSYHFYGVVVDELAKHIKPGGIGISCGWSTNGFGIRNGFEAIEILDVHHGLHHNDTLVLVERKNV